MYFSAFIFFSGDTVPWWAKPVAALYYGNVMSNMLEMETYLQENSADLDYTVVKMPTGTKQYESGRYSVKPRRKMTHLLFEPRCEKTGFMHMRKQRSRSASR